MIKVIQGDILGSHAQTLVNTVNCVGVMGAGIALEFKKRFPVMFKDYVARCNRGEVRLGKPYIFRLRAGSADIFEGSSQDQGPELILNFPTKDHWRSVSSLADIVRGLEYLAENYRTWGISSLAVPPLGCGHGQLEWRVVGRTLFRHLAKLDIAVDLYAPFGTPVGEMNAAFLGDGSATVAENQERRLQPAWVAIAAVVWRLSIEPYHWPIGRTTFQKIAYFATMLGLPTELDYKRGSYGPYSADLKRVSAQLINNGVLKERRLGRMFEIQPGPTYSDAAKAYERHLENWHDLIERIADLFLRMQTRNAEIAATIHFAAHELKHRQRAQPTELQVFDEVRHWKQKRRPAIGDQEISQMIRNLNILQWAQMTPSEELPLSAQ